MLLPAPVRFSTTNCWPKSAPTFCASTRAAISPDAPGPKPMMIRTGRTGSRSAAAVEIGVRLAIANATAAEIHRDIGVAMIKALVGLGAPTYQTRAWPDIEEIATSGGFIDVADGGPDRPML